MDMCNCSKCENGFDDDDLQSSASDFSDDDLWRWGKMRGFENEIFWAGFRRSKFLEKIRIPCNTIEGALSFHRLGLVHI